MRGNRRRSVSWGWRICAIDNAAVWVRRITDTKRLTAKLAKLKAGLLRRRHDPVPDQGKWLASVINGH